MTKLAATAVLMAGLAAPARAQSPAPAAAEGPVLVTLGAGIQWTSGLAYQDQLFPNVATTSTVQTPGGGGLAVEIGGGVRAVGPFGLGATYSFVRHTPVIRTTLALSAPGAPDAEATLEEDARRHEAALHLHLLYMADVGAKVQVVLAGGPSYYMVEQDLVANFGVGRTGGGLNISGTLMAPTSGTAWGIHGAATGVYRLSQQAGIGAQVRYAHASVDVANPLQITRLGRSTTPFTMDLGGWSVVLGVHLRL